MLTVEEGYRRAAYQRSGVRIVMGAVEAREERVAALAQHTLKDLPGDWTWANRALCVRLGFLPCAWARAFGALAEGIGHCVSEEEWKWLHGPATLVQARAWLIDVQKEKQDAKTPHRPA
jgi:hypothetical protein